MGNNSDMFKAYLSIILVCIIWGVSFVSTKVALTCFSPLAIAFYRFLIATIILFIIIKIKEPKVKIDKCDYKLFILSGFIGVFLYFLFENIGLQYVSASIGSILLSMIPVIAMIFDTLVYKEPFTFKKTSAVLVSVIGVCFVVGLNFDTIINISFIGVILMFLAALSWVLYSFYTKNLYGKYSTITITYYQTLFGTLFFLVLMPFNPVDWPKVTLIPALNIIFLGILCSALCYLFYVYSLEKLDVVICTVFVNLMPLVTIIVSIFAINEKITFLQMFGGILIILSVFIITGKEKDEILPKIN